MRLPIWYVLASDGSRHYRDLTVVSATVLRHVDPACEICLLTDRQSADSAERAGVDFASIFNRVIVGDSDDASPMHRSRSLKLRLRLLIEGDFVYVDSDTLAVTTLDAFPRTSTDVAMAYDFIPGHRTYRGPPAGARTLYDRIGWPEATCYFNGGVALWRDSDKSRAFAECWYQNWRESVLRGVALDQPALGRTHDQLGGAVSVLPASFNAQVHAHASFARNAHLWHFWYSHREVEEGPSSILDQLVVTYHDTNSVDLDTFDYARKRSYPWVRSQGFLSLVQTGNYLAAVGEIPVTVDRMKRRVQSRRSNPG